MKLNVGTSGYSYKEWKGSFYPEKLAPKDMLHFYAERLPAVEINNTFYRLPNERVLTSWAEQVPESFRFSLKASRRITHFKRLKNAEEETEYLLRTTRALGDQLGAILFQLHPNLRLDLPRLESFVQLLPEGFPAAFEFRHESWLDDGVIALLRDRNLALCVSDGEAAAPDELLGSAGWGYLRLRRPDYERADLARWAQRIAAEDWGQAFVFFKHEDEAAGPRLASEFLEVAQRAEERKDALAARPQLSRREAG